MKYTFLSVILLLPFLRGMAQLKTNAAYKQDIKSEARATMPRFTDDNGSSALSGSLLFRDVLPTSYDLLAANLAFSEKNQVQKISFAPFKLRPGYIPVLTASRLSLTNNGGALTAGFSVGDDYSAYESKRVERIFNKVYDSFDETKIAPVARAIGGNESAKEYMDWYKTSEIKKHQDLLLEEFDKKRLLHVFKWSAGMNFQFFPVLKSKSEEGNFDSLNYHGFKGRHFFASGSYSYCNGSVNVNGAYSLFNKRKSADSTQEKRKYNGISLGASVRLFKLIKMDELKNKDFYKNNLFIPSVYAGISYEKQTYKGAEAAFAEDKLKWVTLTTFFIDVAVSPASQFRIAFPIKRSQEFSIVGKNTNLVTVLQYNFKLINLN